MVLLWYLEADDQTGFRSNVIIYILCFIAYPMAPASLSSPQQFMPSLAGGDGSFPADQVAANIQSSTASMRHIISQAAGYNPQDMYQLMADQRVSSCYYIMLGWV